MVGPNGKGRVISGALGFVGLAAPLKVGMAPPTGAGGKPGCPGASGRKNQDATEAHWKQKRQVLVSRTGKTPHVKVKKLLESFSTKKNPGLFYNRCWTCNIEVDRLVGCGKRWKNTWNYQISNYENSNLVITRQGGIQGGRAIARETRKRKRRKGDNLKRFGSQNHNLIIFRFSGFYQKFPGKYTY